MHKFLCLIIFLELLLEISWNFEYSWNLSRSFNYAVLYRPWTSNAIELNSRFSQLHLMELCVGQCSKLPFGLQLLRDEGHLSGGQLGRQGVDEGFSHAVLGFEQAIK